MESVGEGLVGGFVADSLVGWPGSCRDGCAE